MRNLGKLTMVLLCTIFSANAQEVLIAGRTQTQATEVINTVTSVKPTFEFMSTSQAQSTENVTDEMAGNHFFGNEIAKKMYLFNDHYSYKVPVAPGNSATKTIFRKPEIYLSVKKIERYLKKSVQKGDLNSNVAQKEYDKVLTIALNILDENTDKFEQRLKSVSEDAPKLLEVYLYEVKLESIN
ncbi:hypothetical protein Palpr_0230 [Paludibacter propionicigenes WB4]|uniref:DUF4142 domain-containing protein n=1 Tax=Paludibacter propionicigenes (strain DSM 17365 / JCM 13257 / WB4) TaxID=694427 RepID=E4T111_PALPW|nr:hypothetical protein [Paludibacter propionicigenes]ADQ78392.1 hypothetical protein Palpr_0230 [Paludibacter propionicigenes WB4]